MFSRRICTLCLTILPRSTLRSQTIIKNNPKNIQQLSLTKNIYTSSIFLAKGKDKKKESKGKKKVEINELQLGELLDVDKFKFQLKKCIDDLKVDYSQKLSLRSTSGSIESLKVDVEGDQYSLQELAQIVRKNPQTVIVNLGSFPQAIPSVLQAIRDSGMNLNPQQEGTTLYIPIPRVTKEYREELAKNAKMLFVRCKDHIKQTQNEQIKKIKKKTGVSEDIIRSVQDQLCSLTDQHIIEAEIIYNVKHEELLGKI